MSMLIAIYFLDTIIIFSKHITICYARCCNCFFMWATGIDDPRVFWKPLAVSLQFAE